MAEMIQYIRNNSIDYDKWDDCIHRAFNGNVYAWSWCLDIVCEGWDALVLNDYEHVMPVTSGKKYGIAYLYQPAFTQQLGVFSTVPAGKDITDRFLDALSQHYRFAEIGLNRFNQVNHPDFYVQMRRNYELELIRPIEELRKKYASNTSRNIRKAESEGISIVDNVDPKAIINMFRNEKGAGIKQMGDKHYLMLDRLVYRGSYKKIALITGAFDRNNQLCAGAFLLKSHHRLVFLFSANNSVSRQTGAMHLLIDRIIEKYAGQPITLDFEGSEIPGLARFYAGFGSTETFYPFLTYNKLPFHIKTAMRAMKLFGLR